MFPDSGLLYYGSVQLICEISGPMKDGKPSGKGRIYLVNEKGDIEQYWEKDEKTGDTIFVSASGEEVSDC